MYLSRHLILMTLLLCMITTNSHAQTPSRVNCDSVFDPSATQNYLDTAFVGQIVFSDISDAPIHLTFLNGRERVEQPELRSGMLMGYYASFSPDGRYMFNFPSSEQNSLTILEISTGEAVAIMLQEDEVTALTELNPYPPANNPSFIHQRLEWVSSTEFVIRRLDLEISVGPVFLFKQSFNVTSAPLSVIRGKRVDFVLDQPHIDGSSNVYNFYSPTIKYLVQMGFVEQVDPLFRLIRVVDTYTQEVLITLFPTGDSDFSAAYLWDTDEQSLFVKKQNYDPALGIETSALHQIDFTVSPPQLTTQMWDDIERLFDGDVELADGDFMPTLSPNGDKIAFKVRRAGEYRNYYLISYDLSTREVAAVCDSQLSPSNFIQTFWSPDERYVGYFDDTRHVLVVMDTQEATIYSLPLTENDQQFLGWVP